MSNTKHILETLIEGELVMIARTDDKAKRAEYANNIVEYSTMYKALTGEYFREI